MWPIRWPLKCFCNQRCSWISDSSSIILVDKKLITFLFSKDAQKQVRSVNKRLNELITLFISCLNYEPHLLKVPRAPDKDCVTSAPATRPLDPKYQHMRLSCVRLRPTKMCQCSNIYIFILEIVIRINQSVNICMLWPSSLSGADPNTAECFAG